MNEENLQRKEIGLYGRSGVYAGALIKLVGGRLVIGRDPRVCNLILRGEKISRKHCSIIFDDQSDSYVVTDHSINGVFLENGDRLCLNVPMYVGRGSIIYIATPENSFRCL
ncbi:MAG: FHA domain-containing protein [Eubacteriales bacterium]|nr:FHA domain-containing protein [Eubacteriales bacterium]